MAAENLKQQLLDLHAALGSGGSPDPEMVTLLCMLDADIRSTLAKTASVSQDLAPTSSPVPSSVPAQSRQTVVPPDSQTSESGLTLRAQEISARFAARHPHLEPVLRELTDTLQRIGI